VQILRCIPQISVLFKHTHSIIYPVGNLEFRYELTEAVNQYIPHQTVTHRSPVRPRKSIRRRDRH